MTASRISQRIFLVIWATSIPTTSSGSGTTEHPAGIIGSANNRARIAFIYHAFSGLAANLAHTVALSTSGFEVLSTSDFIKGIVLVKVNPAQVYINTTNVGERYDVVDNSEAAKECNKNV